MTESERDDARRQKGLGDAVIAARRAVCALQARHLHRTAAEVAHRRHVLAHCRQAEQAATDAGIGVYGPC